jgi:hypothetical protein
VSASGGYVRLYRSLLEHALVTQLPAAWFRIFVVILLKVNWKPGVWWDGSSNIDIPAGSMITSVDKLSRLARATTKQTRGALGYLQTASIAAIKTTSHYTVITVLNWGTYQNQDDFEGKLNGELKGKARAKRGQSEGKPGATIEEGKKGKHVRREEHTNIIRGAVPIDDAAGASPFEQEVLELAGVRKTAANLKDLREVASVVEPERIRGGVALGRLRHISSPAAGPITSFRFFLNPITEAVESYAADHLEHTVNSLKRELARQAQATEAHAS